MKYASTVLLVSVVVCSASAAAASERAAISLTYGGTVSKTAGDRDWQPSLWLDGSYRLVGPLQAGLFFRWLGEDFGLKDPGFGGGVILALRPSFSSLRILGAVSTGGTRIPIPSGAKERSWTLGFHGGLGYAVIKFLALEARFRYERYFRVSNAAPDDAWTIEGGLTVVIP